MLKILKSSDKVIKENLKLLAKDYKEKTGRKVCLTCPSDIAYMILSLKNYYKMTNFEFKRERAQYKNKKGDTTTISNNTMTDERAIEFLKTNPKRIELFSKFPENWKKMLKGEIETPEQAEARLAAEAELAIAEAAKGTEETEEEIQARLDAEAAANDVSGESIQVSREDLMKKTLKELRAEYPEVKATSIKDFVDKVLKS